MVDMVLPAAPAAWIGAAGPAGLFHRLSSYDGIRHWSEPADDPRVRADFVPMRPGREPAAFKEYPPELPVVNLPLDPPPAAPAAAVLGGGGPRCTSRTVGLDAVAAILFQAAGITRSREDRRGRRLYFRAASSAGNRHPIELYLCARGIGRLADGVWHYDPRRHALTLVGPAPEGAAPALVLTGVPWRTCWKYAERGYRHLWWDCGTVVAQALVAGRAQGLPVRVETAFVDREVGRLVGARPPHEVPLAVLPLTAARPALTARAEAEPGELGPGFERFPLVESVHAAGELEDEDAVVRWRARHWRSTGGQGPHLLEGVSAEPLDALVRRRRSTRRFDPDGFLPAAAVRWMAWAAAGPNRCDGGRPAGLRLVVHAVDGVAPGAYRWSDGLLERMGPADRESSRELCLDQQPAYDSALLAFFVGGDREPTARAYRAAQLSAGIGLGRLYLAGAALGVGCTGLTFVDALLPEFGLAVAALGPVPPRTGPDGPRHEARVS